MSQVKLNLKSGSILLAAASIIMIAVGGCTGATPVSDTAPRFAVTVANQTHTEGVGIAPLALPEASGGNGTLAYSLTPTVPGLTFNAATRTLSGAPTTVGSYDMTYQAVDGDDNTTVSDAATLRRSPSRSRYRNRNRLTPPPPSSTR